jgi:midasin (ATPase involved in ribosome maturation)
MVEQTQISEFGGKTVSGIEFMDEHGYLPKSIAILKAVGNLRLVGETGSGKTTLVYALAQKMGMVLYEIVLTRDISRWDLLACDILKDGKTITREGLILKWLKNPNGGILYLDGFNYGENGVVSLIESLADFRGNVYIPELGETLERTKEHYIIISYNPTEKTGYSGTFIQNIATMRRFEGLIVDYLSITAETKIVKKYSQNYDFARKFVELASKTRELYKKSKLRTPLTTGNIINYAKLWKEQKLSEEEIIEIAKSLYPEDELSQFAKLYEDANELDLNKLKQEAGET